MLNPTLTITSISLESNYLKVEGTIKVSGEMKGRTMVSYYPKNSTTFNIQESVQDGEKGKVYTNFFNISNHMGGGSFNISELLIGSITQGAEGKAFTSQTFTEFMTTNTGA